MNDAPAIALLELSSLSHGTFVADAMTKRAQLATLRAGSVQPGKYLILIGGEVGPVQESYVEGIRVGAEYLDDHVILHDAHPQVAEAVNRARRPAPPEHEALGVFEALSIPAVVGASDRAIKSAEVDIIEIRLGDGLGGKGVTGLSGRLHDVQSAMATAVEHLQSGGHAQSHSIIASAHADIVRRVSASTRFHDDGAGGPADTGGW